MKPLLAFGIIGSLIMIGAGINMSLLESKAGNTVAEAFYNSVGWGFIGLGIFLIMLIGMIYKQKTY